MSALINRVIGHNSTAPRDAEAGPGGGTTVQGANGLLGSEVRATPWGVFAGLTAFALSVAISPAVASITFTPKYAVALLLGATGLVPLVVSLRGPAGWRRRASYGASSFLIVAFVSALLSQAPNIGIFGLYGWGTGWLLWLGAAGGFAVGCRLNSADQQWLFGGLLAGALANTLMAIYQIAATPTARAFSAYHGTQADGFLGNPVFFESLLLGAIALVSVRAAKADLRSWQYAGWCIALGLMAVALEFSDERAAVGLLAIMFVGIVLTYRRKGLVTIAPTAAGYVAAYLNGGSSLGARIAQGTGSVGFHLRLDLWRLALSALVHRPFLGFGPAQLEAAINPRMNLQFARALQTGTLFSDSHNIVIEVMITTGLVGLACFIAWVVSSLLGARNYFVYFALMCLAVELVEPLNIAITPLAFLALGASLSPAVPRMSPKDRKLAVPARLAVVVLCATGLLAGADLLVGDWAFLNTPPRDYSLTNSETANSLLFFWPDSSAAMTQYYRYAAAIAHNRGVHRRKLELALTYSKQTAARLPFDPMVWVSLGDSELALGKYRAATSAYMRALRADRWSFAALDGLGQTAMEEHHFSAAQVWYRKELQVLPPGPNRTEAQDHLRDAERGVVPQTGL